MHVCSMWNVHATGAPTGKQLLLLRCNTRHDHQHRQRNWGEGLRMKPHSRLVCDVLALNPGVYKRLRPFMVEKSSIFSRGRF